MGRKRYSLFERLEVSKSNTNQATCHTSCPPGKTSSRNSRSSSRPSTRTSRRNNYTDPTFVSAALQGHLREFSGASYNYGWLYVQVLASLYSNMKALGFTAKAFREFISAGLPCLGWFNERYPPVLLQCSWASISRKLYQRVGRV